jgi:LysR family transcriptional regulator, glycine cleavage system transcriptional activator
VDRLPLVSVRTFAVVARLLSISRAAEELSVTPSAVSHQIKSLETYLGITLFHRERNRLRLTATGQQYMAQVTEGLLALARATKTAKATKGQQVLRIAAPASFAVLWLIDRVGRFMKQHPGIAVNLTTMSERAPLLQGAFDLAFWYGGGTLHGLSIDSLGANRVFPICKPQLVKGEHGLRSPSDLARCTLLDSGDDSYYGSREDRQPAWFRWLHAAGMADVTAARTLSFTPRMLMHQAVLAGVGVGVSRSLLAVDALSRRDVVVPFGPAWTVPTTYNLVIPSQVAKRKDIATFREWILAEAATSVRTLEKMLNRRRSLHR